MTAVSRKSWLGSSGRSSYKSFCACMFLSPMSFLALLSRTCTSSTDQPRLRVNNANENPSRPSLICTRLKAPTSFYVHEELISCRSSHLEGKWEVLLAICLSFGHTPTGSLVFSWWMSSKPVLVIHSLKKGPGRMVRPIMSDDLSKSWFHFSNQEPLYEPSSE